MRIFGKQGAGVLIAAATVSMAAGIAYAAIPSGGGVISACYAKKNGVLRVIDAEAGARCVSSESALAWNQQGPPGPQGVQGERGPQGSAGFGTAYITGGRFHFIDLPKAQSTTVAELSLPAGKFLVHGKVVAETRNQSTAGVVCGVRIGAGGSGGAAQLEDAGIARLEKPHIIQATLSVDDVVVLAAPSIVVLTCHSGVTGPDSGDPAIAYATRVRLVAIPAETVNIQPGLGS